MARPLSKLAPDWWDYTTLDPALLADAARLTIKDISQLSRPGFQVHFYDSMEDFHLAEALEYIEAWQQSTADNPAGICGPIGPTEQLPLVARLVNSLQINLRDAHFWGMDEWYVDGQPVPDTHPLSFIKADRDLCFNRIDKKLRMPANQMRFPAGDLQAYSKSYDQIRCVVMQGGQGETKHWAFNDPPRRSGKYKNDPPSAAEYCKLPARVAELHPMTISQNARTSAAGNVPEIPTHAGTVGPVETFKAERVSIWHPGVHDNVFGMRLTALMVGKRLADSSVPVSLLCDHPDVHFHYYRPLLGSMKAEMH